MTFVVRKPSEAQWSAEYSGLDVRAGLAAGQIVEDWLICPPGETHRAVPIAQWLAQPAMFEATSTASMPAPAPASSAWITVAAAAAALVGFAVALAAGGWLILLLAIPFAIGCVVHFVIHWRASGLTVRPRPLWFLLSNGALLLGFLLQRDFGDSHGWLAITGLVLGKGSQAAVPPGWWPGSLWMNLFVFIPYFLFTLPVLRSRRGGKAA